MNKCLNCGKETKNPKFCSRKCNLDYCRKRGLVKIWNKGLTKQSDARVMRMEVKIDKILKEKYANGEIVPWQNKLTEEEKKIRNKKLGEIRKEGIRKGRIRVWNDGLTKENDEKIKKCAEKRSKILKEKFEKGELKSHIKGLTKETNLSILKQSDKMKEKWKTETYVRRQMQSKKVKPNKAEAKLDKLLQKYFPNQWKYVGDGQFILGGKCPDFVNMNGRKQLIELFGNYWHKDDNSQDRINYFKQYGFNTLIIWENELLKQPELVFWKILKFYEDESTPSSELSEEEEE